jgi:glycerol-3-phosphate cytidylyltransferase
MTSQAPRLKVGYAPGAYDLFHVGHLSLFSRARQHCDRLVVGVATDELVEQVKGRRPIVPYFDRLEIVRSIRLVDLAMAETSTDKSVAWRIHKYDILFKGSDWEQSVHGEKLEAEIAAVGAEVVYLGYTEHVSSTLLRASIEHLRASATGEITA